MLCEEVEPRQRPGHEPLGLSRAGRHPTEVEHAGAVGRAGRRGVAEREDVESANQLGRWTTRGLMPVIVVREARPIGVNFRESVAQSFRSAVRARVANAGSPQAVGLR
jgi:hypothetical protein